MPIRLMENFRAVFYAPYYATVALGFYKREGVDVELLTSDAPGDAVPKLLDGSIDLTWGGPMRVMKSFCSALSLIPRLSIRPCGTRRQVKKNRSANEVPLWLTRWVRLGGRRKSVRQERIA